MENVKSLLKSFSERPISFYAIYARITGSIPAGLLLSQCCYWYYAMGEKEFYKTDADFCTELSMGLYELKTAKKKLQSLGLLSIIRKGIPAKTFYHLQEETLITLITSYGRNPQLVMGETHNLTEEKPTTIYTETTAKITTLKSPPNPPEGKHVLSPLALSWNETCKSLPQVKESSRKRHLKESIRITERSLEEWKAVFEKIEASDFCKGNGNTSWRATYDWIIHSPDNAIKVLEGKYDNLNKEILI